MLQFLLLHTVKKYPELFPDIPLILNHNQIIQTNIEFNNNQTFHQVIIYMIYIK